MRHTIIKNCKIIDGLGNPTYEGAVSILGDKIVDQKNLDSGSADEVIDATGLTLMPGLIDVHCHSTFDEPSSND